MSRNLDIRSYAKQKGVYLYEVAEFLGISEPTITRRLRTKLSNERKAELIETIDRVAAQHAEQATATAAQ